MRRYLFILLVFGSALLACNSENTKPMGVAEASIISSNTYEYVTPALLSYSAEMNMYLWTGFRPIGWSSDGKLAYITEPADQACGCYFFSMFIKDMRTNEVLWKWEYNDNGTGENLEAVWNNNYTLFKEQLNRYKITQISGFDYSNSNRFEVNKQAFALDIKTQTYRDTDYGIDFVKGADINLIANSKGEKNVWSVRYNEHMGILDANICGYFKSPYDNVIAVVYKEERMGYEGPPHVVDFEIVGTDIQEGF